MIVGLSLGSVITMFFNGDVAEVYLAWAQNGVSGLDLGLGLFLLIVGVSVSYLLVRVQRKADGQVKTPPDNE